MSAMTMKNLPDLEDAIRNGEEYTSWTEDPIIVSYSASDDQFVVCGVTTKRFTHFGDALFCLVMSLGSI
jgi:hypothetical protein